MILVEKTNQRYKKILFIPINKDNIPEEIQDYDIVNIECKKYNSPIYDSQNNEIVEYNVIFQKEIKKEEKHSELKKTDIEMTRSSEDLIDVLLSKDIIKKSDLPNQTVSRLENKKKIREEYNNL